MYRDIVNKWLTHSSVPKSMKNAIKKMSDIEKSIAFADKQLEFGTAGIRAKMGPGTQYLNLFVYQQMAMGYGKFLKIKYPNNNIKVIVAHDNRNNGLLFSKTVGKVLSSMGINVYFFKNNHLCPTPLVSFAIRKLKMNGAVIVTASHNPKQDNGFKVYNMNGAQLLPDDGEIIVKNMPSSLDILDLKFLADKTKIFEIDEKIIRDYYSEIKKKLVNTDFKKKKKFPVIFTGLHGTASKYLPKFLNGLGYNIKPVIEQCKYDGNFSYVKANNPENKIVFDMAIKYASKYDSNIMIAVDPDADRFALAVKKNNKWNYFSGNDMGIIFTYYMLLTRKFEKPYLISSSVSTNFVDRIAKKFGAKVIRVGTGFKWMGNKIDELKDDANFVVAFEEAIGSLNFSINRDKDSFQAASLALEIIEWLNQRNTDMVDFLYKEIMNKFGVHFSKTISILFKESNWKQLVDKRMKILSEYKERKILDRNIININWNRTGNCLEWNLGNDSFIKFRQSGTEPKFKIYFNLYGDSYTKLKTEASKIKKEILKLLDMCF